MRIYVFTEHYPNPYKPWIDTQLVQLLKSGHELTIVAQGAYRSTIHAEVRRYKLDQKTVFYPTTLRTLPAHLPGALGGLLRHPQRRLGAIGRMLGEPGSLKEKFLNAIRILRLPAEAPDICYIHNLATAASLPFLRALYPKARICLYFHGGEVGGMPKVQGERAIFDRVHAVVTGTAFAADQAVERGCERSKIAVAPLGFDLADYTPPADRAYRPGGVLRMISIGRLSQEKGYVEALKAVQRLTSQGVTDISYRIVGSGQLHAELQKFVDDHKLGAWVTLLGEKEKRQVIDELIASDVLVLPSLITETWAETQAAVVQEALLMGCLTLTTRAGGVPESNAIEMHRFSVPPGDCAAIAAKILELRGLDQPAFLDLARAGRSFATKKYDIAPLMDRIVRHAVGQQAG